MFKPRFTFIFSGVIFLALLVPAVAQAQQQPGFPGQRGGPGAQNAPQRPAFPGQQPQQNVPLQRKETSRIYMLVYDQYSYKSHPFFQLTGVSEFEEGKAATGGTGNVGNRESDADSNFLLKAIHMLPPFAYEQHFPTTEMEYPKSFSIGLDYSKTSQTDKDAYKKLPAASSPFLPRFEMDSYLLSLVVRAFLFPSESPGVNIFMGYSLGSLHGNLLSRGTGAGGADTISRFSKSPANAFRLGVDVRGDIFGGRFEMINFLGGDTNFSDNPFPGQTAVTSIDMSSFIIRIAGYWKLD